MSNEDIKYLEENKGEIFDLDEVDIIVEGDWENDYKDYCFRESVIQYNGNLYKIVENRSGSYYSDYHYDDPEIFQVVAKEVLTTVYERV